MNERPTPETDACISSTRGESIFDLCKKLERERDEARSMTEHQWLLRVGSRLCVAGCKSDGILDSIDEIIRERDEAREALREWQTLRLWGAEPQHIHDFIKGQQTRIHESQDIEKTCEQLERERDEAQMACQLAHDRLLRGDNDREILDILAKGWRPTK